MFEAAEIAHHIDKERYAAEVPELREALLTEQFRLLEEQDKGVLILVAGVEGAGKGDTVNLLQTWLDPRDAWVHGFGPADEHDRRYPPYQRYWQRLPPKGKASIFVGSWYTKPIIDRVFDKISQSELDAELFRIRHFERMLVDEGYVLLKLWFHLSRDQQKKRLKRLESEPSTRWRVTKQDWDFFASYDRFAEVSTRALRETSTGATPWTLVAGAEPRYRHLTVGRAVLGALKTPVARPAQTTRESPTLSSPDGRHILDGVDLTKSLSKKRYEKELEKQQGKLAVSVRAPAFRKRGLVAVFEGWDAAGKGGAIRRVTAALDARWYHVKSVAAPTDEELARPFLWRFWRNIPTLGKVIIFDRSWYGRVLVERVEGFAPTDDWMRAYGEINDFEEQLADHGFEVCKFWLHIDAEEQLRRFEARKETGFKRHKLTDEDWRNRDKWPEYERAVHDMIERTSTEIAPWTIVPAVDKRYARIEVLRTLVKRLER